MKNLIRDDRIAVRCFTLDSPRLRTLHFRWPTHLPRCSGSEKNTKRLQILSASSLLEAPTARQRNGLESDNEARISSNLSASSSSSEFYDGAGQGNVDATAPQVDAFSAEIEACEEADDILEILGDEAELMAGRNLAFALKRIGAITKARHGGAKLKLKQAVGVLARSEEFGMLLALIVEKSYEMSIADVVDCLWSVAFLDLKAPRFVKHLQKEIELRVTEMDERELATAAWSFATLRHNPGALMEQLAEAALPRLANFETKGLSMMLWAYSKLDHTPPTDFLSGFISFFNENFVRFGNQSIANIVYAMGKLKQPLRPGVCRKVEQVIADPASKPFRDSELANILYGFVKTSYRSPAVLAALEDRIARKVLIHEGSSMVWATLIWGAASLGLPIQSRTLDALQEWGLKKPEAYNSSSICNLAWGLALSGEAKHPVFQDVIKIAVKSHEKNNLEPRLMRQLYQAVTSARILGASVTISEELEQTAYKWWRKGTLSKSMSMTHEAVSRAVKKLGLNSEAQHNAGYGLPLVDVAIEARDQEKDIAMMIVHPSEFSINLDAPEPLGRIQANTRLLEAAGWNVVNVPATSLHSISSERTVIKDVGRILQDLGLPTDWKQVARASPSPVPKSISSNRQRWDTDEAKEAMERDFSMFGGGKVATLPTTDTSDAMGAKTDTSTAASDSEADDTPAPVPPLQSDLEDILVRSRKRRQQVAEAMEGDFMEGWVSLAAWRSQKTVIPGRKGD